MRAYYTRLTTTEETSRRASTLRTCLGYLAIPAAIALGLGGVFAIVIGYFTCAFCALSAEYREQNICVPQPAAFAIFVVSTTIIAMAAVGGIVVAMWRCAKEETEAWLEAMHEQEADAVSVAAAEVARKP